ncbi:MAG TPA: type II toxin-antitoxin system RelE/ParE family toxin [Rhodanobacteraceae bacterium]|nr:type II toxin-antitoxin system RelE/ParE family toxin [Rhodanobacteraceae bacterium]
MADRRTAEYRLTPAAQRDLDKIFDYTVREWGLEQAVAYTAVIEKACARLAKTPDQAKDCGYIRTGYRRAIVSRHAIYFRVEDYGVAVVRILHQHMDAPRHL